LYFFVARKDRQPVDEILQVNYLAVFYKLYYLIYSNFMNIYIGNLNYRVRENDLQEALEEFGAVDSVKIITDRETGRSKGFAFAEMSDDAAAQKAINALNETEFEGRQMVVKEALPKK
jgi:RNA recognition motif-containing protein